MLEIYPVGVVASGELSSEEACRGVLSPFESFCGACRGRY